MKKFSLSLKPIGRCNVKQPLGHLKRLANYLKASYSYLLTLTEQSNDCSNNLKYNASLHSSTSLMESINAELQDSALNQLYENYSTAPNKIGDTSIEERNNMLVKIPPAYSLLKYIYKGAHVDDAGKIDDRIWFSMLTSLEDDGQYTFLVFPAGGTPSELQEVSFDKDEVVWG